MWLPSIAPMMLGMSERLSKNRALRSGPARVEGNEMTEGVILRATARLKARTQRIIEALVIPLRMMRAVDSYVFLVAR